MNQQKKKQNFNSNSRIGGGQVPQKDMKENSGPQKSAGVKLSDDKILGDLNQSILDHLETAGYQKIAKLLKEEMVKAVAPQ